VTRVRTYSHFLIALGFALQVAVGYAQLCDHNAGLRVMMFVQIPFQLLAWIIHGLIMKRNLRKGSRPNIYVSALTWVYDLVLFIFTIMTWVFMKKESCGVPIGATVMFYSNLLSTLLLIQSVQIYNIIQSSIILNILTCC